MKSATADSPVRRACARTQAPSVSRWRRAASGWWILQGTDVEALRKAGAWRAHSYGETRDQVREWLLDHQLYGTHFPTFIALRRAVEAANALDPAPISPTEPAELIKISAGDYRVAGSPEIEVRRHDGAWKLYAYGEHFLSCGSLLNVGMAITARREMPQGMIL